MKSIIKSIISSLLALSILTSSTVALASTYTPEVLSKAPDTMTNVGDSVTITPDSNGMINFSVTGSNAKGAVIVVSQCFNNGSIQNNSTSSCVSTTVTRYNATSPQNQISTDDSYYTVGSTNCYYLLQMYSDTTKNGVVTIAAVTTTPPVVNQSSGSVSLPGIVFDSLGEGGSPNSIPGLSFIGFQGNTSIFNNGALAFAPGYAFNGNTIKKLNVVCVPFVVSELDTNPNDQAQPGTYNPVPYLYYVGASQYGVPAITSTGIGGGDVTFYDHNASGITVIGVVTVPFDPGTGPFRGYGNLTLSTPYAVVGSDQITASITRADNTGSSSNYSYQGCTVSANI